jgi:hypothetical protein
MPFNHEAEANEPVPRITLAFKSGKPVWPGDLPMPPSAHIAMGWWSENDKWPAEAHNRRDELRRLESRDRSLEGAVR